MDAFWNGDFVISKIALCCYVPPGKGRTRFLDRLHHGLALLCEGETRYHFDGGAPVTLHGGEVIYLPQGADYRVEPREAGDCYAINFDWLEMPPMAPFTVRVRDAAALRAMFAEAERCWRRKRDGDLLRCRSLLYGIFSRLQAEHALGYGHLGKIRPAVDCIREHFADEKLTVASLAAQCGITPEYFRALFRKQFGVSPLRYINALRVERAEELLRTGLYTVSEAAMLSGFGDLSQCSREFKKVRGVPPSTYLHK